MCLYKREEIAASEKNILFRVIGCIYSGIKYKVNKCNGSDSSWTDGMLQEHPEPFVEDVCVILKVNLHLQLLDFKIEKLKSPKDTYNVDFRF